jgi:ABC-type multidrug transport system fused ATPase/permease subunit
MGTGGIAGIVLQLFGQLNIITIVDISIVIVLFMLFKHLAIPSLSYFQYSVVFKNDIWLRNQLLIRYLNKNLMGFSKVSSSDLIRNTSEQVGQISYGTLLSLLTILSEFIVVLVLIGLVLFTLPIELTILIILVFLLGFLPFYIFNKRMILLGKIRFNSVAKIISGIQNIYNLFIEIKLYKMSDFFLNRIKIESRKYANAQIQNNIISIIPKGIIEIAAILVLLLLISTTRNQEDFLPIMGTILATIFRITPSFTRISAALTQLKFSVEQINVLHAVMQKEAGDKKYLELNKEEVSFKKSIEAQNISFNYEASNPLFNQFNLKVIKGDFVLFKGESGNGKSTMAKMLLGLITPLKGEILIDGIAIERLNLNSWHDKVGYVPQKPVIIEGDLRENICIGVEKNEFNEDRFQEVIVQGELSKLYKKIGDSKITEGGGSISGGQLQRIGIARALYRNAEVLILDEPTSALDIENAQLIDNLLVRLNHEQGLTIIMISHSDLFDKSASKVVDF